VVLAVQLAALYGTGWGYLYDRTSGSGFIFDSAGQSASLNYGPSGISLTPGLAISAIITPPIALGYVIEYEIKSAV
jgi:hypothetical protein